MHINNVSHTVLKCKNYKNTNNDTQCLIKTPEVRGLNICTQSYGLRALGGSH